MIVRTQALVLQIRPWSKTSHMVTWLTPDYGKIVTSVKGACRPKSAFLGQYDLFYTCDLLFYRRDHDGVHIARECAPTLLRDPLRHDWRRTTAAAYLADLTARVAVAHPDAEDVFELLSRTLDRLAETPVPLLRERVLWYEIHLLRLLGLLPDLASCPLCHTDEQPWLRFSFSSGRFVCQHLASAQSGEATLPIHRDIQALFFELRDAGNADAGNHVFSDDARKKIDARPNLLLGLSRFLGMFIVFHLDVPSAVRRIAFEMIDTTHAQKRAIGD